MLSKKTQKILDKIRTIRKLVPLNWKTELTKEDYYLIDQAIYNYVKSVSYVWYFKNVAFYDESTKQTYYFARIVLTRKNLYFIKAKTLQDPLICDVEDPLWNQKQGVITSPIVTEQYMINNVLVLLNQKQFLATCTINLVLLEALEDINITNLSAHKNIHVLNTHLMKWSDIIKHIEITDDCTEDTIADETILNLHYALAVHSHRANYRLAKRSLYSLYHFF